MKLAYTRHVRDDDGAEFHDEDLDMSLENLLATVTRGQIYQPLTI